jgi:hypothetical protein
MTVRHDISSIVRSWIREEEYDSADRVLQVVLSQLDSTPQRRPFWQARRFPTMNSPVRYAIAAAAVLVVALVGYQLLSSNAGVPGAGSSALPTAEASPSINPSPEPSPFGGRTLRPFSGADGFGMCPSADIAPECVEDPRDETMTITVQTPASWDYFGDVGPWIDDNAPPDGAAVFFYRGNWLYSDPCLSGAANPDIPVGPTVDDLVTALIEHPSLDVTAPVDVTLAGYSGTYLDLTVPDDISDCSTYQPIEAHIYAQGPGHRWHMWILDVDGVRVLVETNDYAGTDPQRLAEIQSILDSLEIAP